MSMLKHASTVNVMWWIEVISTSQHQLSLALINTARFRLVQINRKKNKNKNHSTLNPQGTLQQMTNRFHQYLLLFLVCGCWEEFHSGNVWKCVFFLLEFLAVPHTNITIMTLLNWWKICGVMWLLMNNLYNFKTWLNTYFKHCLSVPGFHNVNASIAGGALESQLCVKPPRLFLN